MSKSNNVHYKQGVKYIINNAIVSNPDPVTIPAFQFFVTLRARVAGEFNNSIFDVGVKRFVDFLQFFQSLFTKT